jgi:chromate transport protein ChrA
VGLIAAAAWHIGRVAVVNWTAAVIAIVCCVLIAKWRVHPAFLVIGSAVAGILFF